jgi:hypothetical protein
MSIVGGSESNFSSSGGLVVGLRNGSAGHSPQSAVDSTTRPAPGFLDQWGEVLTWPAGRPPQSMREPKELLPAKTTRRLVLSSPRSKIAQ